MNRKIFELAFKIICDPDISWDLSMSEVSYIREFKEYFQEFIEFFLEDKNTKKDLVTIP